ncbi:hypothetical protein [Paraburkholderia xenovorans]|uniref:hypothetical protein n=1 Tax=Paraburkholderia xenovorans TaxID=36873 RepID=UPI0038BAD2EB
MQVMRARLNDVGLQRIRLQFYESSRRARNVIIPSNHGGWVTAHIKDLPMKFTLGRHGKRSRYALTGRLESRICCAAQTPVICASSTSATHAAK